MYCGKEKWLEEINYLDRAEDIFIALLVLLEVQYILLVDYM